MWYAMLSLSSSLTAGRSTKKRVATDTSASLVQVWNQSKTVQFTSAGNWRARMRNLSPTGEKHRMTCKYLRTCECAVALGHGWKVVMRVPGELLVHCLLSPTGEKHRITCRYLRT